MSNQPITPALVGLEEGRISIFGTKPEAISKHCLAEWKSRGNYSYVKVGEEFSLVLTKCAAPWNRPRE